jgi:TRAP-type transport system small permease protein
MLNKIVIAGFAAMTNSCQGTWNEFRADWRAQVESAPSDDDKPVKAGTGDMDKFFERLSVWIERALALAFAAAVILSFVNVIGRYVFGATVIWADEIQIYIMIWMAFLGAVVVTWRQMHLRMDLLFRLLPARMQSVVRFAEFATLITLAAVVVGLSGQYAYNMLLLGRLSDVAQVPMWIPHGGVSLGFSLILLIALWQVWKLIFPRQGEPAREGGGAP